MLHLANIQPSRSQRNIRNMKRNMKIPNIKSPKPVRNEEEIQIPEDHDMTEPQLPE